MFKYTVLLAFSFVVCLTFAHQIDEFEIEEDIAVESQVRYLDLAREALLELSAKTRREKHVTNAFLKVIDGFEKNIANFQASLGSRKVTPRLAENLKKLIKEASIDSKMNRGILRSLTAQGLFLAQTLSSEIKVTPAIKVLPSLLHAITKRRYHNYILEGAIAYLQGIRDDVGEELFEKYLSVNGSVTLIFAIDDTASMTSYINGAIAIAIKIVKAKRDYAVDYILSPFNDPKTGPITVNNKTQGNEFVKALTRLRARGGGDCAELAFKGMIDALESGPEVGSSMYVFTDASPKDVSPENIERVLNLAHDLDIPVNFFNKGHCGRPSDLAVFGQIADKTGGLVYPLKTTSEIAKLGRLVVSSLRGSASVAFGGDDIARRRRRRRELARVYTIFIDDSIEQVLVKVTTQNSGAKITLVNPQGKLVIRGRVALTRGTVYDITKPVPGHYKLVIPDIAGRHKYRVNAVSGTNIDFGHYYAYIPSQGRNRIPVPLEQPLQGSQAAVFVTIAGVESVDVKSLSIKVIDEEGKVYKHLSLRPVGSSGVRYIVKFNPPSGAFKLELHGRTKKGNQFVRTSIREDQATPVIMRLSYTPNPNVLFRGNTTTLRVQIRRGDIGNWQETYTVSLKDKRGYGKVITPEKTVKGGRIGFAQIKFTVPAHAPKGKIEKVEVILTKQGDTEPAYTLFLSLLIV